jgi:hypothetical protein
MLAQGPWPAEATGVVRFCYSNVLDTRWAYARDANALD